MRSGGDGNQAPAAATHTRGAHAARVAPAVTGGGRVSGLARPSTVKVIAACLVVLFGAAGFAGGLWSSPSAEPTMQSFLLDWQQHSYAAAAGLTTGDPASVAADLRGAYARLDAASFSLSMGYIRQQGTVAWASFNAGVELGENSTLWTYQGQVRLRETSAGWKVDWSPSVINPGLRTGLHLAMTTLTPGRGALLDAAGRPLAASSAEYVVGVIPSRLRSATATARALGRVTGLEASELAGWIQTAPSGGFQELVQLTPTKYRAMAAQLQRIHGLITRRQRTSLFSSVAPLVTGSVGAEDSPALRDDGIAYRPGATVGLSGLQASYQSQLAGSPTTKVVTEDGAGHQISVLRTWSGNAPAPVRTTIELPVQRAADRVVRSAGGSATLVAVSAATGRILAAASHTTRGVAPLSPLAGKYPPGEAFTMISAEALLATGLTSGAHISCVSSNDVGGRTFHNPPGQSRPRGNPTFGADFAHACDTAMVGLSARLSSAALRRAADQFGLDRSWGLPRSLGAFSGSIPDASGPARLASETIGQGGVLMSPLTLAMIASEVESGQWRAPSLVAAAGDPSAARQLPFSGTTLGQLRALMRGTVTSGVASGANLAGAPVYGQVGTVQLAPKGRASWGSWFVGYRGGVAFAVLRTGPAPSPAGAVPLATRFLLAVGH